MGPVRAKVSSRRTTATGPVRVPAPSTLPCPPPLTASSASGSARRFGRAARRPPGTALLNGAAFGKGTERCIRKSGRCTREPGETGVKGSTNLPWRPRIGRRDAGGSASGPAAMLLLASKRTRWKGGFSGRERRIWRSDTQIHPVLSRGCGRWRRPRDFRRHASGTQRTWRVYFAILWLSTGKPTRYGGHDIPAGFLADFGRPPLCRGGGGFLEWAMVRKEKI